MPQYTLEEKRCLLKIMIHKMVLLSMVLKLCQVFQRFFLLEWKCIGKFTLIFLTDSQEDQFYRNKSIAYLPQYTPSSVKSGGQEDTLQLSRKQATQILRDQNTLNNACIISSDGRRFYPESSELHFGGSKAHVKVDGWFTGGIVATIKWNGHQHEITKKGGFMTTVLVNDKSITSRPLNINDTITVGRSIFKYALGDSRS